MRTWSLLVLRQFLHLALSALCVLATAAAGTFKSRAALQVENLALRHQLGVLRRSVKRPKLSPADRFLWVWLCQVWSDWRSSLVVVKPETVVAWHRKGFRLFWTWKVRHGQPGRPTVPKYVRELIRKISRDNPLWGAPRIHGELLKLGIDVGETSVGKYMVRHRKPPSQTWRTFLENHLKTLVGRSTSSPCRRSGSRSCMSSWCWLTTGAGFSTSASRRLRRRSGLPSNSATHFRGTAHHAICCEIGIGSSATNSRNKSRIWASRKSFLPRDLLGSERTSNA